MTINITDRTPGVATLRLTKISDIYGKVLVVRGWA